LALARASDDFFLADSPNSDCVLIDRFCLSMISTPTIRVC
jgi:hypothetical protein